MANIDKDTYSKLQSAAQASGYSRDDLNTALRSRGHALPSEASAGLYTPVPKKDIGQKIQEAAGATVNVLAHNIWETPGALLDMAKGATPQQAADKHFINPQFTAAKPVQDYIVGAGKSIINTLADPTGRQKPMFTLNNASEQAPVENVKGALKSVAEFGGQTALDIARAGAKVIQPNNTWLPTKYDDLLERISPGSSAILKKNNTAQNIGAVGADIATYLTGAGEEKTLAEAPAIYRLLSKMVVNGVKDFGIAREQGASKGSSTANKDAVQVGLMSAAQQTFGKIPLVAMGLYNGMQGFNEIQEGIKENDPTKVSSGLFNGALGVLSFKEAHQRTENGFFSKNALGVSPDVRDVASQVKSALPKKSLGEANQNWLGAANPGKGQYTKFEVKRGKDLNDMAQLAIENGISFGKDEQGKINSINQAEAMKQKSIEIADKVGESLDDNFPRRENDLEKIRVEAKKNNEKYIKNAAELQKANANVDALIDPEIARHGQYLTDKAAHDIKQGMWGLKYDHADSTKTQVAGNIGWQLKDLIEKNNPDANVQEMNNLSGQYKNLSDFLLSTHGTTPKGGRLGGMFHQILGQAVVGSLDLVNSSEIPVISGLSKMATKLIGAKIGQSYNEFINDPERITLKAIQDAKKAGVTSRDKKVLDAWEAGLVKRNIDRQVAVQASVDTRGANARMSTPRGVMQPKNIEIPVAPMEKVGAPRATGRNMSSVQPLK